MRAANLNKLIELLIPLDRPPSKREGEKREGGRRGKGVWREEEIGRKQERRE